MITQRLRMLRIFYFLIFNLLLILFSNGAIGAVCFVDSESTSSGDGTSWPNAFVTIQEAIDAPSGCGEVWGKKGIYLLDDTIYLDRGIALYGGFNGTENMREREIGKIM